MSETKISTIVGAVTDGSTKEKNFEIGTKGRTTDGKLVQYGKIGSADIPAGSEVEADGSGTFTETAAGNGIGTAETDMKAGEYGFIVLIEKFGS